MHTVVDVGGPDAGGKQQQLKGEEVHGYKKEHPTVRHSLHIAKTV